MRIQPRFLRLAVMLLPIVVVAGCLRAGAVGHDAQPVLADPVVSLLGDVDADASDDVVREVVAPAVPVVTAPEPESAVEPEPDPAHAAPVAERPEWLGKHELPNAPDDGSFLPTPPELADRRLPPPPTDLPEPASDEFALEISEVSDEVLARSTWAPECPVAREDLRYLLVTHWGFDDRVHTGEVLVHASVADQVGSVFARLHRIAYPIEELRIISPADMTAVSSGDGNVSSAFVCRRSTGSAKWSEHSYGTAIDLNPFHNPYVKGSLIIPGLAGAYADRHDHRPGMIQRADEVIAAFSAIGWKWGGDWNSSKDWMHFSATGR